MTREEAISVIQEVFDNAELSHCGHYAIALDMAIEALSADAVEVVRCKDCKNRARYAVCDYLGEDGYCSLGKSREDGEW